MHDPEPRGVLEPFSTSTLFYHVVMKNVSTGRVCACARVSDSCSSLGFRIQHMKTIHYCLCKQIGCEKASEMHKQHPVQAAKAFRSTEEHMQHMPERKTTFPPFRGLWHVISAISYREVQHFPNAKQHLFVISLTFLLPSLCPSPWASWLDSPVWCSADTWVKQSWQGWRWQ